MPLSENSQLLVNELQSLPLLEGRYANLRLVNFDEGNGEKRGCFSLVFSADDRLDGVKVALKFFDLDPAWFHDQYRKDAFRREHTILQSLLGKARCLQLASPLSTYQFTLPFGDGKFTVPCEYFAVQWVDFGIDDYFFNEAINAVVKLKLFTGILLAVEALHRSGIFHRDLKADNLRATSNAANGKILAIDLGTAARLSSGPIQAGYGNSVGAPAYAAPEAHCGLAGNRLIAPYTDLYALGCLLFELLNPDHFVRRLTQNNPHYVYYLSALRSQLTPAGDENQQIEAWDRALARHAPGIIPVVIDGPGSNLPGGVSPTLNDVLSSLTHFDYRRRQINLEKVRAKIGSAIKLLENQAAYDIKLGRQKELRRQREEKARKKDERRQQNQGRRVSC